ncbi:MAG: HipA N-terminal domain-containing protein, partial [Pseudomonadota bacterium]
MARVLDVYLHESLCGQLTQGDDGRLGFTYHSPYLTTGATAISVAMPLQEQTFNDQIARAFFSGLLPDERARDRLAAALGVSRENAFGLLEIIGGECAGALTLLPVGVPRMQTGSDGIEPLSDDSLGQVLTRLRQRPLLGGEQGVRLSLAGAQDKLAVCLIDNQVALPKDGRATTHILKPFIEGLEGTVENELFCMMLASRVGLDAPAVTHGQAGDF